MAAYSFILKSNLGPQNPKKPTQLGSKPFRLKGLMDYLDLLLAPT